MRSFKQDLVGFHWSAFFEPRLPLTRVPVKLPPPPFSPFLSPPSVPFPPPHSSSSRCTYCQLKVIKQFLPDPKTSLLLSLVPFWHPSRLGSLQLAIFLYFGSSSPIITKIIPLSKNLWGDPFFFILYRGSRTKGWRDFYTALVLLS